jgi:hypothetical protein
MRVLKGEGSFPVLILERSGALKRGLKEQRGKRVGKRHRKGMAVKQ